MLRPNNRSIHLASVLALVALGALYVSAASTIAQETETDTDTETDSETTISAAVVQPAQNADVDAEPNPTSNPTSNPNPKPKPVYDEDADAKEDIAAALQSARQENRRVLIQWGANWCGWCKWLHHLCETDREIARKLQYEYDVVRVDIGRWDKHIDLTEKYGADLKQNGVPYLTILDSDGRVVVNQETASLEVDDVDKENQIGHDREKVLAFLTKHQAEYRQAGKILEEGLSKATRENKRVFLHFGAPWCGWCHRLEDWMARPKIAEILAKEFVNVKIDIDRTIGGKKVLATYRGGERGGIPWMAILDAEGHALVTSDGPRGNVGFPVRDHEVAHFMAMLREHARNLTADDLEFLEASLRPKDHGGAPDGGAGH